MANRKARTFAAILAIVALTASPAIALDGEVLIDQAKAAAGGVTPDDSPGFPVTLSRSGKYKLTGNLKPPVDRNAVVVTADNVTIDLNGFRMLSGKIGVNAPHADGLTVMNGTIANFSSHGIATRAFAIIQDMQIADNGGAGVSLDNNGRVIRSTISGNANGVFCLSKCLVADNVITGSPIDSGVNLQTTAGGHLVLNNVIANNEKFGIYAEGPTGFANNTLTGNATSVLGAVPVHPNYCSPACP